EIEGEHIHRAPQMEVPAAANGAESLAGLDAFALFRERARARDPEWDMRSPAESNTVAEILRLLDGIPLSIEFAAAWVGSRTLEEITNGIGGQRRDLLRRRAAGQVPRHDSIQASLEYSFDLLASDATSVLPKLSVFGGGLFAQDATAVTGTDDAH